mmetsp:Transcript_604/g.763  ORF Transcript_604/g.763 Transcript_604/m.763 type:complete len:332 (-) Transcript_604:1807-2802(-)
MEIIRDDNNEMKNTTQNLTVTVPTTSTTSLTSREGRIFTVPVNIIPMFQKYNQQHKHKHKHKCMSMTSMMTSTTSMTTTSTTTSLHASSSTCSSSSNNSNSNSDGSEEEETIAHTNSSQRQQAQNDNDNDNNRLDISSDILEKVIEYCTYYTTVEPMNDIPRPLRSNQLKEIVTQEWYYNFISSMSCMDNNDDHDHDHNDDNDGHDHAIVLFRLVNAANHLKIQPLLNLAVLATALCINSRIVRGNGDYDVNMEDIKSVFKVPSSTSSSSSSSSSSLLSPSSSSSSMISSSSPSPSSPLSKSTSTTRSSTQKTKDIETSPLLFSQVNTFNT